MPAIYGVDYSWDRPNLDVLYSQGKRFIGRYLSYSRGGKSLSVAEADRAAHAGLGIVLVWEHVKDSAKGGYVQGRAHAQDAQAMLAGVGAPRGPVIYFAVDFDATAHDLVQVGEYLCGAATVIGVGRMGVYGGIRTVAYAFDHHLVTYAWQTYAWSGGRWHDRAQLRQYHNGVTLGGGTVDLDVAVATPFGMWSRGNLVDESFGDAPPPSQLDTSFDYTATLGLVVGDLRQMTSTVDAYTRMVNALRG